MQSDTLWHSIASHCTNVGKASVVLSVQSRGTYEKCMKNDAYKACMEVALG
jgi:hypothetical protein